MKEKMNGGSEADSSPAEVVKCWRCGCVVSGDAVWYDRDGNAVCEDCHESDYMTCSDCGEEVLEEDGRMVGDKFFCDRCADEWCECDQCGEAVQSSDAYTARDGDTVCQSCREDHFFRCRSCGELYHNDHIHWDNDAEYCDECYEEHCREKRDESGVFEYHEFECDYTPRRCGCDDCSDDLLLGVELEADCGEFDFGDFDRWADDGWLVHFEHDGSLSEDGVECITMPCSLRFHQERMDWKTLCSRLLRQGFRSHDTDDCGLHVHLSRGGLTPIQIMKLDVFVNRSAEFLSQVARRTAFYSAEYDRQKRMDVRKGKYGSESHNQRYTAVNTTNKNTVEIRIFRGSLNHQTVLGTVELCHAMAKFVDTVPVVRIYRTDENIAGFVKYLADNHEKYPNVFPMLRRLVRNGRWKEMVGECYGKFCEPSEVDGEV